MGARLQRSAFSPNIKERCDFSCAVFDALGSLVAQAAHIPVHLGAMPLSVSEVSTTPLRVDNNAPPVVDLDELAESSLGVGIAGRSEHAHLLELALGFARSCGSG